MVVVVSHHAALVMVVVLLRSIKGWDKTPIKGAAFASIHLQNKYGCGLTKETGALMCWGFSR